MARAGLTVESGWIIRAENYHHHAYQSTRSWLAMPSGHGPTIIVALTAPMVTGVMNVITYNDREGPDGTITAGLPEIGGAAPAVSRV